MPSRPFDMALKIGAALLTCGLAATPAAAGEKPVVVELFTSQGCSSCPPADRLLSELAGHVDVLPLAFHVTYWNALGWRDPFSFEGATTRQADYATHFPGGSYTPEIVVDGRRAMVGSDRGAVGAAIASARNAAGPSVVLRRTGEGLAVSVAGGGRSGRVLLVGFDPRHETPVGRGENAGRTLIESNVVRSVRQIGRYEGRPLALAVQPAAGGSAAVLVQAPDGAIIAAGAL